MTEKLSHLAVSAPVLICWINIQKIRWCQGTAYRASKSIIISMHSKVNIVINWNGNQWSTQRWKQKKCEVKVCSFPIGCIIEMFLSTWHHMHWNAGVSTAIDFGKEATLRQYLQFVSLWFVDMLKRLTHFRDISGYFWDKLKIFGFCNDSIQS